MMSRHFLQAFVLFLFANIHNARFFIFAAAAELVVVAPEPWFVPCGPAKYVEDLYMEY